MIFVRCASGERDSESTYLYKCIEIYTVIVFLHLFNISDIKVFNSSVHPGLGKDNEALVDKINSIKQLTTVEYCYILFVSEGRF